MHLGGGGGAGGGVGVGVGVGAGAVPPPDEDVPDPDEAAPLVAVELLTFEVPELPVALPDVAGLEELAVFGEPAGLTATEFVVLAAADGLAL